MSNSPKCNLFSLIYKPLNYKGFKFSVWLINEEHLTSAQYHTWDTKIKMLQALPLTPLDFCFQSVNITQITWVLQGKQILPHLSKIRRLSDRWSIQFPWWPRNNPATTSFVKQYIRAHSQLLWQPWQVQVLRETNQLEYWVNTLSI